jgi:hypothetical protein
MANNPTITGLTFACTRLRDDRGYQGHAVPARLLARPCAPVEVFTGGFIGLAQGRIVSISRGSPPPKKR